MKIRFGEIIKRAWQIMWRHKVLWVLGMFAGISGGCQGGVNSSSNYRSSSAPDLSSLSDRLSPDFLGVLPAFIAIIVVFVLIGLVWWILSLAAQGGLIAGVDEIEAGRAPRLGALWKAGFSKFLSLWGLDILAGLPLFLVGVGIVAGAIAIVLSGGSGGRPETAGLVVGMLCGVVALLPLLIVGGFVLGVIRLVGQRYIMFGGRRTFQAFGDAWRFLRGSLKNTLLMYLINCGLNLAASVVITIPIIVISIPFIGAVFGTAAFSSISDSSGVGALFASLGLLALIFIPLIIILSLFYAGVWGTYTSALGTLFFRQMTGMDIAEQAVFAPQPPLEPMMMGVAPTDE
ncbi:MAG: hypothetical protein FWE94_02385 [Coriobacteriia bacterium]|nr:hypothetical protein [Coriobacteriia bacterium]